MPSNVTSHSQEPGPRQVQGNERRPKTARAAFRGEPQATAGSFRDASAGTGAGNILAGDGDPLHLRPCSASTPRPPSATPPTPGSSWSTLTRRTSQLPRQPKCPPPEPPVMDTWVRAEKASVFPELK